MIPDTNQVCVPSRSSAAAKSGPPESPSQVSAFDVAEPAHIWCSALSWFQDANKLLNNIKIKKLKKIKIKKIKNFKI